MITVLWSAFAFLVAIGLLITVHEFGHFWVARRLNIKVLRFSIGFGKPLFTYKGKHGTEYIIAVFPLGGYVKMLDENEGVVEKEELHLAFNRKPLLARAAVVCAGPLFNILFAIFAYWLMYVIGVTAIAPILGHVPPDSIAQDAGLQKGDEIISMNGREVTSWQMAKLVVASHLGESGELKMVVKKPDSGLTKNYSLKLANWKIDEKRPDLLRSLGLTPYYPPILPIIEKVLPASAAAEAGLRADDKIIRAAGQSVNDWNELLKVIHAHAEKPLALTVLRNGKKHTLSVTPKTITSPEGKKVGYLGVQSKMVNLPKDYLRVQKFSIFAAWNHALIKTWDITKLTFQMLGKIALGKVSFKTISGPIGIAKGAGITASLGISYYLNFLGLVSVSLAILNILPIPILDGGHLLYYLIEAVRRKPLSEKAQAIGMKIGLMFILTLMFVAFYNDFARIFT